MTDTHVRRAVLRSSTTAVSATWSLGGDPRPPLSYRERAHSSTLADAFDLSMPSSLEEPPSPVTREVSTPEKQEPPEAPSPTTTPS
jgi:hypothetical protein